MNLLQKEELLLRVSEQYENRSPQELIQCAVEKFPNLVLACSFGAEDVILLDMLYKIRPNTDVFYLDTELHFKETYETRDRIEAKYAGFHFIQMKSKLTLEEQAKRHGSELWSHQPDLCCHLRKVEPLTRILGKYDAWITGIRRNQAPTRANTRKAEYDYKFGLAKFNPLASWTLKDVWDYIKTNDIPYNPLHDQNYPSIGCEKCTRPVLMGEDPRAGRWADHVKTECGLHK
jgi:phosphoadenosine phosphosulfate reductase